MSATRPRAAGPSPLIAVQLAICTALAVVVLAPIAMAVLGGFRTNAQLLNAPLAWPRRFVTGNYADILRSETFWRQVASSVAVMLMTTLLALVLASAVAFVFARMAFRGREALVAFFSLGLLFPATVAILPLYIFLRQLGLVNSLWGIILPQVAFALPWNVLILRNFFQSVPRDLQDAAYVDGASPVGFLLRILLPLVRPGLAAVAVLTMVGSWNNYLLPLLVLDDDRWWTLPLGVMQYRGQFGTDWARVLAFVSLAILPAVGFYLVAERQIIAGLTAGSVKG